MKKQVLKVLANFKRTAIMSLFILEYNVIQLNLTANLILMIYSQLRNYAYIILPVKDHNQTHPFYFSLPAYFIRFQIFLTSPYCYILFAIFITIAASGQLFQIIYHSLKQNKFETSYQLTRKTMNEQITESSLFVKILNIPTSLYAQFIDSFIINIAAELTLNQFENQSLFAKFIIIYTLVQNLGIQMTKVVYHKAFAIQFNNQHQARYTFIDSTLMILNVLQIGIYEFSSLYKIQNCISVLIAILNLFQIIYLHPYTNQKYQYIIIAIQSGTFIFGIIQLFQSLSTFNQEHLTMLQVIWIPFAIVISFRIFFLIRMSILSNPYKDNIFSQFSIIFSYIISIELQQIKQNFYFEDQLRKFHICENCHCSQKQMITDIIQRLAWRLSKEKDNYYENQIICVLALEYTRNYLDAYLYASKLLQLKTQENLRYNVLQKLHYKHLYSQTMTKFHDSVSESIRLPEIQFTEFVRLSLIQESCQVLLTEQITINASTQHRSFAIIMNEFLLGEKRAISIQTKLLKCLTRKIQFYQENSQKIDPQIYDQFLQTLTKITRLHSQLEDFNRDYPSVLSWNCLILFNSEILRDLCMAAKLHSMNSFMENFSLRQIQDDFLDDQVCIVRSQVISGDSTLEITNCSDSAPLILGKKIQCLDDIIPDGIREHHNLLVYQFFYEGNQSIYKQSQIILLQRGRFICRMEMFVDAYFISTQLQFTSIIKNLKVNDLLILINNQYRITGISEQLYSQINQPVLSDLYQCDIHFLIHDFEQLLQSSVQDIQNTQLILRPKSLKSSSSNGSYNQNYIFDIRVQITTKLIQDYVIYYLVTIFEIRQASYDSQFSDRQSHIIEIQTQQKDEEDQELDYPYEFGVDINQQTIRGMTSARESVAPFLPEMTSNRKNSHEAPLLFNSQEQALLFTPKIRTSKRKKNKVSSQGLEKDHLQLIDQQSINSSTNAFHKSKYWSKYELVTKLRTMQPQFKISRMILLLSLLSIIISGTIVFIQAYSTIFDQFNITLGQSDNKADVLSPLVNFALLRAAITNYISLYKVKLLNLTQLGDLELFTIRQMPIQYQDLVHNIQLQQVDPYILSIFDDKLQVSLQNTLVQAPILSIEYRTLLNMLLQFQQKVLILYTSVYPLLTTVWYTVDFFFAYANYYQIYTITKSNQLIILDQIDNQLTAQHAQNLNLIIILMVLVFILQFGIIKLIVILTKQKQMLIDTITSFEAKGYQHDIQLTKLLQNQLDTKYIQRFKFNHNDKEVYIDELKSKADNTHNKLILHQQYVIKPILLSAIFAMAITVSGILNYSLIHNFQSKAKASLTLYTSCSDLTLNIGILYQLREFIYINPRFPTFNQSMITLFQNQFSELLKQTRDFNEQLIATGDFSNILASETYLDFVDNFNGQNLCLSVNNTNICQITLGGNMLAGVQRTLTYITSSLHAEYQFNKFASRNNTPINELEGVYQFIQIITKFKMRMHTEITKNVSSQAEYIKIVGYVNLVILILLIFLIYDWKIQFENEVKTILKFFCLIPETVLFTDDSYERRVRNFIILKEVF